MAPGMLTYVTGQFSVLLTDESPRVALVELPLLPQRN